MTILAYYRRKLATNQRVAEYKYSGFMQSADDGAWCGGGFFVLKLDTIFGNIESGPNSAFVYK